MVLSLDHPPEIHHDIVKYKSRAASLTGPLTRIHAQLHLFSAQCSPLSRLNRPLCRSDRAVEVGRAQQNEWEKRQSEWDGIV